MKNKKKDWLRYLHLGAKASIVIGELVFVISLASGFFNVNTQKWIKSQYQDTQQTALVTHIDQKRLHFTQSLWASTPGNLFVHSKTQQQLKKLVKLAQLRQNNQQQVDHYYDGSAYYANGVSTKKLNHTDRQLLLDKNQTVYQKQKNRLDTIRIWFEQTRDAQKYLTKTLPPTNNDHNQTLTMTQASEISAYYKLLKNRTLKKDWQPRVAQALQQFKDAQKNQSQAQKAQQQKELTALKNAPLTQDYQPANVTIIDKLKQLDQITRILQQAGITSNTVLVYLSSTQTLNLVRRSGDHYVPVLHSLSVVGGSLPAGSYVVRRIINNASATAGVVTDPSSASFGRYFDDATTFTTQQNDISDFNQTDDVFWLKNNLKLQPSILVANASQIGFLADAPLALDNTLGLNLSDLNSLMTAISIGVTLYVD
ncbi:hypothetical protein MOO45_08010 [Bombilactobacillus folatiphilus]|uniref:Uncharacterized protein n=1 Tax=Bombilactobacillus folatiphilus TaxID=2923362 RepID=A0ABY4P8Q7_9LACO|nr:hypothetical protein [Bombilactobacillus folatiphilus]UQS82113.1 hypothetical protein MOO45_08010 [Bombilactobacillus folatiphilus]